MDKKYKQFRGIVLGCLVTAGIYVLIAKNVEIDNLSEVLCAVELHIFLWTILLSFLINIVISSYKLRIILKALGLSLGMKEVLFIKMGSSPLASIFPFRTGELSKAAYLNKVFDFPFNKGIASVVLNLGSNLVGLFFILAVGILFYPLEFYVQNIILIIIAALFLLMFFVYIFCRDKTIINIESVGNTDHRGRIRNVMRNFLSNVQKIGMVNTFYILGLSFVQTFGELIIFFMLSKSLGLLLPFKAVLFFFPLINLIARLPIAFLGLGTREAVVIISFSRFADRTVLLSLGMLYSFVEYILPIAVGLIVLPFFVKKISKALFSNGNGE